MKHRNPFMVLFLSIITLGIYDLYWLVKTKTVLNKQTKIHTPTVWLLFLPVIFFIIIFIFALIIGVHSGQLQSTSGGTGSTLNSTNQDTTNSAGFTLVILLFDLLAFVVIIPVTFYWFFKFSKGINEYTSGELNTGVTFLLLWLLHFIGVIIVQDKFNDMMEAGTIGSDGTLTHAAPGGPPAFAVAGPPVAPMFNAAPAPTVNPQQPFSPQVSAPVGPGSPVASSDQSPQQVPTVPTVPDHPQHTAEGSEASPEHSESHGHPSNESGSGAGAHDGDTPAGGAGHES